MSRPLQNQPTVDGPDNRERRPTGLILLAFGCVLALVAGVVFMVVRLTADPDSSGDPDRTATSNQDGRAGDGRGAEQKHEEGGEQGEGSVQPAEPVAIPDPCEVVPREAVAEILPNAAALHIPLNNKEGDPGRCEWIDLVDSDPVTKRYVAVEFVDLDKTLEEWRQEVDTAEDVAGLGEHAYSFDYTTDAAMGVYEPEGGVTVYFAHGDLVVRVSVGGWYEKDGEAVGADPDALLEPAVQLGREIAKTSKPSGPFARPFLERDTFEGEQFGEDGCERIPTDLATRLMAKQPEEGAAASGQLCRLISSFDRAGPEREGSRHLHIALEDSDTPGDAALDLRRAILTSTRTYRDITEVRDLPDLGDEAYLLVGRTAAAFNGIRPDETLARVLIRRGTQVLQLEFGGSDFPPGADSFLQNPEYEPMSAEEVSNAAMELTNAYLATG